MRAVAAALQANYIINSRPQDSALTQEQVQKVIDYATQSLRSANTTDEEALNRLYPEFGTRFKRDFCGGQRLLISGLTSNSRGDLVKSSDVDRAWKDWYNPNRKQIEDAFNAALQ
jgi:23S rRNA G2445 N2-methylase RlmL